jgi:long-chain acyl-CoA synthetase
MPSHSYVATVLEQAEARPDALALADASREVSYAELARRLLAEAARLRAQGVAAGDTIALDCAGPPESGIDQICTLYGLGYLGATVLPLPPALAPDRRERIVAALGARRLGAQPAPAQASAPRGDLPARLAVYRFSTGSTGEPKASITSNAQWTRQHAAAARALDFGPEDRLLPAIPMPHPIGLRYLMRIHAAGGALVNVHLPRELEALAALVRRHAITRIAASPAQLRWLASRPAPPGFAMPPLAGLVTGGAPLSADEQRAIREKLCPRLYLDYGAVEFSIIGSLRPGEAPEGGLGIVEDVEAEIVDERGQPVAAGAVGQLRVRAAWAPAGYAGGLVSDQYRDGWFYPGDLARLASPRRLVLAGRIDDVINRSGIKIPPQAIESEIARHPDVADVAVAGVPDRIAGEVPVAFVVLRREAALQELPERFRGPLGLWAPEAYVAVNAIPRSPEGKVLRAQLRALVKRG